MLVITEGQGMKEKNGGERPYGIFISRALTSALEQDESVGITLYF